MINESLKNGEIQLQPTIISSQIPELKSINPEELCNIDTTSSPDVLALGLDTSIMMNIVTNSMYKNKLISLQELPANGRDAIIKRIESGDTNFKPKIIITVDLKNKFIEFKDNGCGMTRKQVDTVYRIFGRSTKRNSATEIGMFGIGAKTPFALVDEYEVSTISMLTHIKLDFIVTKRALLITKEEPTIEEPGTSVKFSIPSDLKLDFYDIKNKIISVVKTWKCPVYIKGIDTFGYEQQKFLISYGLKESDTLESVSKGNYNFADTEFKFLGDNYSFLESPSGSSKIYIGHVPYDIDYHFPININIILNNPNIITLTATREGLEKDSKYDDLINEVEKKIRELLLPNYDKYFKNLPETIKNAKGKINIPNNIISIFKSDPNYPYFDLLNHHYRGYNNYYIFKENLRYILSNYYPVFWTNKKINDRQKNNLIQNSLKGIYGETSNPAIIYLVDLCIKPCIFCSQFKKSGCDMDYETTDLITNLFPQLPNNLIEKEKLPKQSRSKNIYIGVTHNSSGKKVKIHWDNLLNKRFTKEPISSSDEDIYIVSEKQFNKLKKLGYKVIEDINLFNEDKIANTYLTDINNVQISAALLNNYNIIFHNIYDEDLLTLIDILFPKNKNKTLILKNEIPEFVIKKTKWKNNIKIYSNHQLINEIEKMQGTLKVVVEIPICRSKNMLNNIKQYINGRPKIRIND